MVGFVHAMAALTTQSTAANLHLRALNPLLSSILASGQASSSLSPAIPRQACQTPRLAAQSISSFAFQGTNAHAVLAAAPDSVPDAPSSRQRPVQQTRIWFAPEPCVLLHLAAVLPAAGSRTGQLHLASRLDRPGLAFLADHVVQGRMLVPGAAMFEMMLATLGTVLGTAHAAVVGIALTAPLVTSAGSACTMSCSVDPVSGKLGLRSAQGAAGRQAQQQHLAASAGELTWPGLVHAVHSIKSRAAPSHAHLLSYTASGGPALRGMPGGMFEHQTSEHCPCDAGLIAYTQLEAGSRSEAATWLHSLLGSDPAPDKLPTAVAAMQQPHGTGQPGAFSTHPAVLDAATHTAAALAGRAANGTLPGRCLRWCVLRLQTATPTLPALTGWLGNGRLLLLTD